MHVTTTERGMHHMVKLNKLAEYDAPVTEDLTPTVEIGSLSFSDDSKSVGQIMALLTQMYENPVGAVVREITSNAIDASVKIPAGERKPVEVGVNPAAMKFTVRDYGTGMTLTEVKNHYLKYGQSTKTFDMDYIGAYGLGSKSPLAYTDNFTVKTVRNGELTVFKLFSSPADGFGYKILKHAETDEPNGTSVTVPVKNSEDLEEFISCASHYSKFSFDMPIEVKGKVTPSDIDYKLLDEITLAVDDDGNEIKGRVWGTWGSKNPASFWLAGWVYSNPSYDQSGYYRGDPETILEIHPGMVDFTSSRDKIIDNERSARLHKVFSDYLNSDQFFEKKMNAVLSQSALNEGIHTLIKVFYRHLPLNENSVKNNKNSSDSIVYDKIKKFAENHEAAQKLLDLIELSWVDRDVMIRSVNDSYRYKNGELVTWVAEGDLFGETDSQFKNSLIFPKWVEERSGFTGEVHLISEVNADNLNRLTRGRKVFSESREVPVTKQYMVYMDDESTVSKKEISAIKDAYPELTVTRWTADEFTDEVKRIRKEIREANKSQKSADNERYYEVYISEPGSFKSNRHRYLTQAEIELDTTDLVVFGKFFFDEQCLPVLNYLENNGTDVVGSRILLINANAPLQLFNAIRDEGIKVLYQNSWPYGYTPASKLVRDWTKDESNIVGTSDLRNKAIEKVSVSKGTLWSSFKLNSLSRTDFLIKKMRTNFKDCVDSAFVDDMDCYDEMSYQDSIELRNSMPDYLRKGDHLDAYITMNFSDEELMTIAVYKSLYYDNDPINLSQVQNLLGAEDKKKAEELRDKIIKNRADAYYKDMLSKRDRYMKDPDLKNLNLNSK